MVLGFICDSSIPLLETSFLYIVPGSSTYLLAFCLFSLTASIFLHRSVLVAQNNVYLVTFICRALLLRSRKERTCAALHLTVQERKPWPAAGSCQSGRGVLENEQEGPLFLVVGRFVKSRFPRPFESNFRVQVHVRIVLQFCT